MEESIENGLHEVTNQIKFMASKYDYHCPNGKSMEILNSMEEKLKAAFDFYNLYFQNYENLRESHNNLKDNIRTVEIAIASMIEKYDLASSIEDSKNDSQLCMEGNKENNSEES